MKKLFYLFVALSLSPCAVAKTVSPSQAEAIASDFLKGKVEKEVRLNRLPAKNHSMQSQSPYYIYNSDGGGFVIVSGDDRFGEILAYGQSGAIDLSTAPEGLTDMLDLYAAAFEAIPAGEETVTTVSGDVPSVVVEPLLGEIAWGQDTPFNGLTPVSTGTTHFYTGCVACAATQIMRLYSYPAKGYGTKTYTDPLSKNTLTADFANTEYQWELMPAIVPDIATAEQTKAYSTLAAHFGIAVEMQYEAAGSGAYDMLVPYALRNYFGYDAGVRGHLRNYYSTSEWMSIIKEELSQGRPVFYGGSSDRGSGGHAFVLDGYDSQDFVHVNWGWYGRSNGYFRINHLDPSSLGEGGGSGGYNLSQDMVTGIRPAQSGSARDYAIYGETRLSVDGPFNGAYSMMSFVGNIDVEPFTGRLEGALVKDGKVLATLGGADLSLDGFKNGHSGSKLVTLSNIATKVEGVADGDGYQLCLVYKGSGEADWKILRHPRGLPSHARASVRGGEILIGGKHMPYPEVVLHSPIETDGDLYAGGSGRALFSMESRTGDYDISEITMRLTGVDNPSHVFDSNVSVQLYNQSVESVDVTFAVSAETPAGKYRLEGLIISDGKEYPFDLNGFAPTEVNVLPTPSAPVARLAGTPVWQVNSSAAVPGRLAQGEFVYITGIFRNAGVPGKAKILARLTNVDTGVISPLIMSETTFVSEKSVAVTFARQIPHDPGTYTVDFVQISDDYSQRPLISLYEPLTITVDPSDRIVADVTAFEFPEKIGKSERVPFSLGAVGRLTKTNSLYIRVRQLTNSKGEIVTMKTGTKFVVGEPLTVSGNYRPGSSMEDGIYMVIVEAGPTGSNTVPLGNHALYARTVAIGNVSSVDAVEAAKTTVAIWLEGTTLRVAAADGQEVESVDIYTSSGAFAARNRYDLTGMPSGIYIVSATLDNGSRTVAKIALR